MSNGDVGISDNFQTFNQIDGLKNENNEIVGLSGFGFNNFTTLFKKLKELCKTHNVDTNKLCITSSSVLSVYGIRDCGDIDLFIDPKYNDLFSKNGFDNHNKYTIDKHYLYNYNEIIHDKTKHFHYQGIKFCNLSIILNYKKFRVHNNLFGKSSIEKDIRDINAIHYRFGV